MRILRGQSNIEVSSQGFAVFVVGLVCATFLGGAVKTLLHSDQVHQRIVSELKARFPKQEIQIGGTEILLSRGIWPGLALRLSGVTFKQDVCGKLSFVLNLPQTTWPLNILSLRTRQVRLKDIEIEGGEIHLDYRDCPTRVSGEPREAQGGNVASASPSTNTGPSPRSITPPKLEWDKAAQVLDGLEIRNFAITYEKNPTFKLLVTSAYVALSDELAARAQLELQKSLPFGAITHPLDVELHGDKNTLQWNFNAEFKEGRVHLGGSLDVNSQAALATLSLRQVPIKDLMNEIYQMGFVDHDLTLKATWLSCNLKWEGQLQNVAALPVQIRDCRLEGGYGRAELAQADLWLGGGDYFRVPALIRVMQLQVQPVLESLNRQVLPAVFSNLGQWSGEVRFSSPAKWQLEGHLENAEILFVNQSSRGKQIIETLHTRVGQKSNQVEARVDDVRLHEGEFIGSVDGVLSADWRDGEFSAQVPRFAVSPAIQKLLVGGSVAPLSIEGQGQLAEGELKSWTGKIGLSQVMGEGWRVEGVQVRSRFQNGTFSLEGRVHGAEVDGSWYLYPQLRAVLHDMPAKLAWQDVVSRFEIQKTGGTLQSLTAQQTGGPIWKAKGSWVRDGEFNGTMNVGAGSAASLFALRGDRGTLSLYDTNPGVH